MDETEKYSCHRCCVETTVNDRPDCAFLGRPTSYFYRGAEGVSEYAGLNEALAAGGPDGPIDATALIEIINRGYCFGTRTLVQGLGRSPVGAIAESDRWQWQKLPEHGSSHLDPANIAEGLFSRLCDELREACKDRACIGLMLSGGMDSRIVACALEEVRKAAIPDSTIVALTWGIENCRDVVYAMRIADMYQWEHRHFHLSAQLLRENLALAGMRGAEYSPVHLHAIPKVARQLDLDIVLAASFGDSVGRGEFSGVHVKNLKPIDRHVYNRFRILNHAVYKDAFGKVYEDAELYRGVFGERSKREYNEIDHQLHYMQRMLVPCMEVVAENVPLYQAFTAPRVYGYMWSLAPDCRSDRIYYEILAKYAPELLDIPWARTGRPYLACGGTPDSLEKHNNEYGLWLRTMLFDDLKDRVLSDEIDRLRVFNMSSLESLLDHTLRGKNVKATQLQELLAWIASLSEFVSGYGISGIELDEAQSFRRLLDGKLISRIHAFGYDGKLRLQSCMRRLKA